jgi:hypothetical protein
LGRGEETKEDLLAGLKNRKRFFKKVSYRIEEEFENYTLYYIFLGENRLIRARLLIEYK